MYIILNARLFLSSVSSSRRAVSGSAALGPYSIGNGRVANRRARRTGELLKSLVSWVVVCTLASFYFLYMYV